METIIDDLKFKAYVVDKVTPFPKILEKAGYEGYSYEGKCFCPFHDNYESPAAKIYHDSNGDTLWCFSESKRYRPSDVLRRNLMKGNSIDSVFSRLWPRLSESKQQALIDSYGIPINIIPQTWQDNQDALSLFKQGKVNIAQHITLMKTFI